MKDHETILPLASTNDRATLVPAIQIFDSGPLPSAPLNNFVRTIFSLPIFTPLSLPDESSPHPLETAPLPDVIATATAVGMDDIDPDVHVVPVASSTSPLPDVTEAAIASGLDSGIDPEAQVVGIETQSNRSH